MAATEKRKPGTFTKGNPRINRNGRPKNFDAFIKLAMEEIEKDIMIAEAILRHYKYR
ncbi:MAG TPA: hypothetical protein P5519_07360 [Spirochaetia bacterium]|nr:hypothetical protein [Spirochaetia bacterium]HRU99350.1 hypothetical protein [Ruminococcus sp.]